MQTWLFTFALATASQSPTTDLRRQIEHDIASQQSQSFLPLLQKWEANFRDSSPAFKILVNIAQTKSKPDRDRYIALMGALRLDPEKATLSAPHFLNDRSWMLRSAGLRILGTSLHHPDLLLWTQKLLNDSALIVRAEALRVLLVIKPDDIQENLLSVLENPANYKSGKPLWLPTRALEALSVYQLEPEDQLKIISVAERSQDDQFRKKAILILEQQTKTTLPLTGSLPKQLKAWRKSIQAALNPID